MPWETVTYRRNELYNQVWERPLRDLAEEQGISDVALAKICKKLGVPCPGRGHWAQLAAGKVVDQYTSDEIGGPIQWDSFCQCIRGAHKSWHASGFEFSDTTPP